MNKPTPISPTKWKEIVVAPGIGWIRGSPHRSKLSPPAQKSLSALSGMKDKAWRSGWDYD